MRASTQEHVERCESATTPASQCRCRCGGRCHGRALVAAGAGREAFEALPEGDPHRLQTEAERRDTRRTQDRDTRQRRQAEKLTRERRAHVERVRARNPELAATFEARWFEAS